MLTAACEVIRLIEELGEVFRTLSSLMETSSRWTTDGTASPANLSSGNRMVQALETGCPKLANYNFFGILFFKGDHCEYINMLRLQWQT